MSLIEIRDASFSYDDNLIFRDVSLSLKEGQVLCLLGPNGSGKTTLLECIMGLMSLNCGSILLNKCDITGMKVNEIARSIAYVPQLHERTFPYRVIDIVLMGRAAYTSIFSSPGTEDLEIAKEALFSVGMGSFADRPYTKLSGGECQLVMLARALAQETPVIVMDEPTAHLDIEHELQILQTVIKLVKNKGITVIMATHSPNHAFNFENSGIDVFAAMLYKNGIQSFGRPFEVVTEDNIRTVFNIESRIISYTDKDNLSSRYIIPLNSI